MRSHFRSLFFAVLAAGAIPSALACSKKLEGPALVAAKADLTTRQLIAGLNAKNPSVLSALVVLTSTTGGPPRSLFATELGLLRLPDPPVEYLGAGAPGTMRLKDGRGRTLSMRLIEKDGELRALAVKKTLAGVNVQVLELFELVP